MKPASHPVAPATQLLDQVRERICYQHYSLRTEQAYVLWVRMFVKWHGLRHPRDLGQQEVEGFWERWPTSGGRPCAYSQAEWRLWSF